MLTYNVHEAKTQFSKLIEAVQSGEGIIIAKSGKPVAILSAIPKKKPLRVRGLLKDQINLGPEFFEPLPKDVLDSFEGNA